MLSSKFGVRLAACLLNVSEAKNKDVVEKIARAAVYEKYGKRYPNTTVLNIFSDYDYNRSVITIAATAEQIGKSVLSACVEGCASIDLGEHSGIHPCLGAIDLVPIYPLSGVTLEECGQVARDIAEGMANYIPGCSIFLFGYADLKEKKSLAEKRRNLGFFRKKRKIDELKADVGAKPSRRYGITGVGASPYVLNCNITLSTQDLEIGRQIATATSGRTEGGLKGVQAMAFPHNGLVEIACNVESFKDPQDSSSMTDVNKYISYNIVGETYLYMSPLHIEVQIQKLALMQGISTVGTALVGFTPQICKTTAEYALSEGIVEFWKKRKDVSM
ncbi:hypothetical protein GDO86_017057 [Hymenochirus boettgeri]|uniref:Formiminotransferase N-terminal subdomain domain-containing protein n=1 Tax=Hymenochirus boettgeri TaxID=247094 RepID=A0A8T2IP63_9PIPI|nr:hypothetical protein GDO86_017057 [Hymenochirus boettgeri]